MKVSVAIVALNEEKYIDKIVDDILKQTYPLNKIELLLIDSGSTDNTPHLMKLIQEKYVNKFYNIQILKNEGRLQAAGWNVALKNYTGDVIARIDAHARITENFIEENVKAQLKGEYVTGGPRPNIIENDDWWSNLLLNAENSMFGSSIASFRSSDGMKYVNSIFHGTYRREVFEKVGEFNVALGRTEDNDIHYRIRLAGYKIYYNPKIKSYQYTRPTLKKMLRQKFLNGYWVGKTMYIQPRCLGWYHLVPMIFVIVSLLSILINLTFAIIVWGAYIVANALMTIFSLVNNKNISVGVLMLPFLFLGLHYSYGVGTIKGILSFK